MSVTLNIGEGTVETTVCWRRIGVFVSILLERETPISCVSLKWEFPVVVEHEDARSNKEGLWKLPNLALTF